MKHRWIGHLAALLALCLLATLAPAALTENAGEDAGAVSAALDEEVGEELAFELGGEPGEADEAGANDQAAVASNSAGEPELIIGYLEPRDNDALFYEYVDAMFGIGPSIVPNKAGAALTGNMKALYDRLTQGIHEIAEGERTSARFDFSELNLTLDEVDNMIAIVNFDCGPEMYWSSMVYVRNSKTIAFYVADDYRDTTKTDKWYVDPSRINAAKAALGNARAIVSSYAAYSDYDKLHAYKDKICALVDYDYDAAVAVPQPPFSQYLIGVFDGDPGTKVVCAGYSRAFQYLCDQSTFSGNIECNTVSGDAGGGHMWNLVNMPNGKNYLADITWCDNMNGGDAFFLIGCDAGSVSGGYTYLGDERTYNSDTLTQYANADLTVSTNSYFEDLLSDVAGFQGPLEMAGSMSWTLKAGESILLEMKESIYDVTGCTVADTSVATANGYPAGWLTAKQEGTTAVEVRYRDNYHQTNGSFTLTLTVEYNPNPPTPTGGPTAGPTGAPTADPTGGPTAGPTGGPTAGPTGGPTGEPTTEPTTEPTRPPADIYLESDAGTKIGLKDKTQLHVVVTKAGISLKKLKWKTSDKKVATVTNKGLVTGKGDGVARITVETSDGHSASIEITVKDIHAPTGVTIVDAGTGLIGVKDKLQLKAVLTAESNPVTKLKWTTSDKKVATVTNKGLVTGKSAGHATITVTTTNKKTASVVIEVRDIHAPISVSIEPASIAPMAVKGTVQLTAIMVAESNPISKLTWTSSNKKVATVNKNGLVTAKGSGDAVITVTTTNKKSASIPIKVL